MKQQRKSTKNIRKLSLAVLLAVVLLGSVIAAISAISGRINPFAMETIPLEATHNNLTLKMHTHSQLSIIVDERGIVIPANIGIDPTLYRNHTLDIYGVQQPQQISPLHTHDSDGLIHIESTEIRAFTLGEFLDVWGLNFGDRQAILIVNDGQAIEIDYRNHIFKDGEQLLLNIQ